jgi:hypothetical protein
MTMTLSISMGIYIAISMVSIGILIYFLVRCENRTKSPFCLCGGIGDVKKNCMSMADRRKLYNDGLTESSELKKNPNWGKRPSWM